jgi:hypothetical protein
MISAALTFGNCQPEAKASLRNLIEVKQMFSKIESHGYKSAEAF